MLDALSLRSMVLDHIKKTKEKEEFDDSDSEESLLNTDEENEKRKLNLSKKQTSTLDDILNLNDADFKKHHDVETHFL